jgi:hypothetical protein
MSIFVLALLLLGGAILYSIIGVTVVRYFHIGKVNEGHNEVIAPVFATAGVIYAVLIGALIIAVWENYDAAKSNAAEEASILTTMYRESSGMPAAEQSVMREHIKSYTENVIKEEWALQVHGGASPKARNEVVALYGEFTKMDPALAGSPINVDFLTNLTKITDHRNKRTLQSQEHLSGLLWFIIFLGGCIVVGMSFFIYMERKWPHIIISSIFSFLIGSLLLVTIVFDSPFSGALAIDSGSFEHSISVYQSVDQPVK